MGCTGLSQEPERPYSNIVEESYPQFWGVLFGVDVASLTQYGRGGATVGVEKRSLRQTEGWRTMGRARKPKALSPSSIPDRDSVAAALSAKGVSAEEAHAEAAYLARLRVRLGYLVPVETTADSGKARADELLARVRGSREKRGGVLAAERQAEERAPIEKTLEIVRELRAVAARGVPELRSSSPMANRDPFPFPPSSADPLRHEACCFWADRDGPTCARTGRSRGGAKEEGRLYRRASSR